MSFRTADKPLAPSPDQPLPLLRPMEVGELVDEAFDLYKKNFRLFFGIAMLLAVPLGAVLVATPATSGWRYAVNIVGNIAAMFTSGALTYAALERYLGRETTIIGAYRFGANRFLRLLSASIILFLAAMGGFLALVIPCFFVLLWGMLLMPIVVVENRGGVAAFKRARELSGGHLWRLFVLALGLGLAIFIFALALVALASVVVALVAPNQAEAIDLSNSAELLGEAVGIVLTILFQAVWWPLLAAAQLLLYLDLRIRREAYDLELLAEAAEARVAAARAAVSAVLGQVGP
jgi:hypothetical protein